MRGPALLIEMLVERRTAGLAPPKQLAWLVKLKHPAPESVSFKAARRILSSRFARR